MQKEIVTTSAQQTQKIGQDLAQEILQTKLQKKASKAITICLTGELGAGKTTFTQGLLGGLKAKGHFTSPTFVIMKQYQVKNKNSKVGIKNVFHLDAYRVTTRDVLDLGWEEIVSNFQNVVIVEWADRVKEIIPSEAIWIKFSWLDEKKRKIERSNKMK